MPKIIKIELVSGVAQHSEERRDRNTLLFMVESGHIRGIQEHAMDIDGYLGNNLQIIVECLPISPET